MFEPGEFHHKTTFVYDTWGNLLQQVFENDSDADGTPDEITTVIHEY